MSLTYPQSGRQSSHNIDRRKGSQWINRQNDPAYNREVQYTIADRTVLKFSFNHVREIVRILCKDQGLNLPDMLTTQNPDEIIFTTETVNIGVDHYMMWTTPINKPLTV